MTRSPLTLLLSLIVATAAPVAAAPVGLTRPATESTPHYAVAQDSVLPLSEDSQRGSSRGTRQPGDPERAATITTVVGIIATAGAAIMAAIFSYTAPVGWTAGWSLLGLVFGLGVLGGVLICAGLAMMFTDQQHRTRRQREDRKKIRRERRRRRKAAGRAYFDVS